MTAQIITLILLATSAFSIACDGHSATEPVQPAAPSANAFVLATLDVVPSTVTLEVGMSVQLGVTARDQRGLVIADVSGLSFSSSNPTIATVNGSGLVRGVSAGAAEISVTKTLRRVTRTAVVKATVLQPTGLASLVITADALMGWQPAVAHLAVGGKVQWVTEGDLNWSGLPHGMLYLYRGSSQIGSLDLSSGSATLNLHEPGEYFYCSAACWDSPDTGFIYVH